MILMVTDFMYVCVCVCVCESMGKQVCMRACAYYEELSYTIFFQMYFNGSTGLQSVENLLWKRLWTCHKTHYRMNE